MQKSKAIYIAICAIPFLALALIFLAPPWPDTLSYESVARDFVENNVFRYRVWGDFDPGFWAANITNGPLYPAIHAVLIWTFGVADHRFLIAFNCLLAFLSMYNMGKILRLKDFQWIFLTIIAFNPLVLHTTQLARPEWCNVFLFTCIWRLLADGRSFFRLGVAALLLVIAALFHQFAIFFIPCIFLIIVKRSSTWKLAVSDILWMGALTTLFFGPYLYYMATHFGEIQNQLFGKRFTESVSPNGLEFLRNFAQPLFWPSAAHFTLSEIVPRWSVSIMHVSGVAAIVALIAKWRKRFYFSPETRQTGFIWLLLNLGCAVSSYSPYVTFFFSVFSAGMLRDAFPKPSRNVVLGVSVMIFLSTTSLVLFYSYVSQNLFHWSDYQSATQCLAEKLPPHSKVYVLAYPDPSTTLYGKRPDLDLRRYIDFYRYHSAWEVVAKTNSFFITSADGKLMRFDHDGALLKEVRHFDLQSCQSGHVHYHLWLRTTPSIVTLVK